MRWTRTTEAPVDLMAQLRAMTALEALVASASKATGLDDDTIRPAVRAFRVPFSKDDASGMVRVPEGTIAWTKAGGDGHSIVTVRGAPGHQSAEHERNDAFDAAVRELPAQARDQFVEWAHSKRVAIFELASAIIGEADGTRPPTDGTARKALEDLVHAQAELERAQSALSPEREAGLAEIKRSLERTMASATRDARRARALVDLEARAAKRIEGALDDTTVRRYRSLLEGDSAAAEPAIETLLARVRNNAQETQPAGDAERRVAELTEQRRAIDEALEQATRDVVRQRAEKLQAEAARRRLVEDRVVLEERARNLTGEADGQQAEVRRLRAELETLRREVEALREKAAPK